MNDLTDPESAPGGLAGGLAVFLWEVHYAGDDQPDYYFGLFDLNAWYQAHMPNAAELLPEGGDGESVQCPYFSFCALEEVVHAAKEARFGLARPKRGDEEGGPAHLPSNLIHLGIDLSSLSRYQSLTNAEQHFYPSSLAFDMTCLLEQGVVHCSNLGFQRKV